MTIFSVCNDQLIAVSGHTSMCTTVHNKSRASDLQANLLLKIYEPFSCKSSSKLQSDDWYLQSLLFKDLERVNFVMMVVC